MTAQIAETPESHADLKNFSYFFKWLTGTRGWHGSRYVKAANNTYQPWTIRQ
jgi:hypothetical protein